MIQQLWNGISMGSIYVLIAVGYTLIFGIIQVIFFAQGGLRMLAAFAALGIFVVWGKVANVYDALLLLSVVFVAGCSASIVAGLLAERIALRPLRNAPRIKPLITSLGASIVFQNAIMLSIGPQNFSIPNMISLPYCDIFGVRIGLLEILIVLAMFITVGIIQCFLSMNRYGLAIRAIAQSPTGAKLMGINPNRVISITFILSSSTAALAGIVMALYFGVVKFDMGFIPGIKGFTVAILGGIGNIPGALCAGLLLGIGEALVVGYISSDYKDLFVFALLIGTLVIRPQGLLGEGK